MSKIVDDLIARAFHRQLTQPEQAWLASWRLRSWRNGVYYSHVTQLLAAAAAATSEVHLVPPPVRVILSRARLSIVPGAETSELAPGTITRDAPATVAMPSVVVVGLRLACAEPRGQPSPAVKSASACEGPATPAE